MPVLKHTRAVFLKVIEMQATLYIIGSEPLKLNKVFNKGLNVDILLKEDTDILYPNIELAYFDDFAGYNYIYIPAFNRYYFTGKPIVTLGARIIYNCTVDPLMSWKEAVNNLNIIIDRSSDGSGYIGDSNIKQYTTKQIMNKAFTGCEILPQIGEGNYSIILAVVGGLGNV